LIENGAVKGDMVITGFISLIELSQCMEEGSAGTNWRKSSDLVNGPGIDICGPGGNRGSDTDWNCAVDGSNGNGEL
jgi:hypothetical protein